MEFKWEAEDAQCGRLVHRIKKKSRRLDPAEISDDIFIISYQTLPEGNSYCIVSFADGMQLHRSPTREELAKKLTENNFQPTSGCDKDSIISHAGDICLRIR